MALLVLPYLVLLQVENGVKVIMIRLIWNQLLLLMNLTMLAIPQV